eukprot:9670694-Ditylum_brightwellii.AAC.1
MSFYLNPDWSVTHNFALVQQVRVVDYLDQACIGLDPCQKGIAMEGKSVITIGIWIHIVYVQNTCWVYI